MEVCGGLKLAREEIEVADESWGSGYAPVASAKVWKAGKEW